MKEKRFFPEKGLLMLSGAAFLLLIVPAWVPGFVWCGVAAVLLCAAVWRLPVSRQRVRALLSNPVHMALSLVFNGALAVNFYHNWVDSQKMQRVAGVLGMENGLFVPLCAAFFAIAAAPAAGCVISYYISAGQEDYRRTKAETLCSGETGIPMGKALLILFAVFVVGISAILRANFYYMDDSPGRRWGTSSGTISAGISRRHLQRWCMEAIILRTPRRCPRSLPCSSWRCPGYSWGILSMNGRHFLAGNWRCCRFWG